MANIAKLNYTADEINEKLDKVCDVVQTAGHSETSVMSQSAVSNIFANALKKSASGEVITVTDASPVAHKVKVKFNNTPKILPLGNIRAYSWDTATPITVNGNNVILGAAEKVYGFEIDGSILEVGKTYTLSVGSLPDYQSYQWGWRLCYADGSTTSVSLSAVMTYTIDKAVRYIWFHIGNGYTLTKDIEIKSVQIEEGDTANAYRVCSSKNLIPFPYDLKSGSSQYGVTATIQEDGGICINGTSTDRAWFALSRRRISEKGIHSYTKYGVSESSSSHFVANSAVGNGQSTERPECPWYVVQMKDSGEIYLVIREGITYENMVVYPQIEVGQISTEYEKGVPYTVVIVDENGEGEFISDSPKMTVWASGKSGVMAEVEYHADINKELANLKSNARLEEYGLPILYINGDTYSMSKDRECSLLYKYGDNQGTCTMKWQGSSSLNFPKKNYTIKFDNAFEAKEGWGEQKKYCLKANYIDSSHARNIVCARIWADFVKSRTTPNEKLLSLPNCGAVDGFPVIIVLNGEFHGLYTFNIPKDKWAYGMGASDTEAVLCAEGVNNGTEIAGFQAPAVLDGNDFEIEYAPDEDNTEWIKTSINRLINACINSDGTDIDTTIAQYVDIDSAIDYYLFVVFIEGFDNIRRNYILTTYDGVKWIFNGYDMDSTFGNVGDTHQYYLSYADWHNSFGQMAILHKLMGLLKTYKKDAIKSRYHQLRDFVFNGNDSDMPPLACDKPMRKASEFISGIPQCVYNEDWNMWRGIKNTSTNNYAQISEFMKNKLAYMDDVIETL